MELRILSPRAPDAYHTTFNRALCLQRWQSSRPGQHASPRVLREAAPQDQWNRIRCVPVEDNRGCQASVAQSPLRIDWGGKLKETALCSIVKRGAVWVEWSLLLGVNVLCE